MVDGRLLLSKLCFENRIDLSLRTNPSTFPRSSDGLLKKTDEINNIYSSICLKSCQFLRSCLVQCLALKLSDGSCTGSRVHFRQFKAAIGRNALTLIVPGNYFQPSVKCHKAQKCLYLTLSIQCHMQLKLLI